MSPATNSNEPDFGGRPLPCQTAVVAEPGQRPPVRPRSARPVGLAQRRLGLCQCQPALPAQASYAPIIDPRSTLERTRRIGQIQAWLQQNPPDELCLPLLDELAALLQGFGRFDEALRIRLDEELPVYEKLGDKHGVLVTDADIAITLIKRGHPQDLPEACRRLQRALKLAEQMQLPKEISTIHQYLDNLPAPRRKKAKKHGRP